MDPQIELSIQFAIEVTPNVIKYCGEEKIEILKWSGINNIFDSLGEDRNITFPKEDKEKETVAERYKHLIIALLEKDSLPPHVFFKVAFIILNEEELIAYDVANTLEEDNRNQPRLVPLLPCYYNRAEAQKRTVDELRKIYNRFATKLRIKDSFPPWLMHAAYLELDVGISEETPTNTEEGTRYFKFVNHAKIFRYLWGEYCHLLPIPSFEGPENIPKHGLVVSCRIGNRADEVKLASLVWDNLDDLNNVVREKKQQVVLLMGEPGSGKEVFARAIHYGSLRKNRERFKSVALTDGTVNELTRRIFGTAKPGIGLVEQAEGGRRIFGAAKAGTGLVEQAEGGTLFLDEFDKVTKEQAEQFYGMLLRVLESKEYYPVISSVKRESEDVEDVKTVEDVVWILAGSFTARKPQEMLPDLWSRINDMISLRNPIEAQGYAISLFLYWFFREAVSNLSQGVVSLIETSYDYRVTVAQRLLLDTNSPRNPLKAGEDIVKFAKTLARHVRWQRRYPNQSLDTVRSVRQAARAAFQILQERAIERGGNLNWETDSKVEKALETAIKVLEVTRGPRG